MADAAPVLILVFMAAQVSAGFLARSPALISDGACMATDAALIILALRAIQLACPGSDRIDSTCRASALYEALFM
ncbi:MAG TPA: hypothetical protein VMH35_26100 [Streptosporangiaceae bacterium]|nr:hypothetical protein [Streptosporangiaceae bacterium]